jgi:predicted RND superfamily exporter protein
MITQGLAALGAAILGFLSFVVRWSPAIAVALIGLALSFASAEFQTAQDAVATQTAWERL